MDEQNAGGQNVDARTLSEILEREWQMFQEVRSLDGPAPCQQDRKTFDIMRASQVRAWTEEIAGSYLDDLRRASRAGRNLMTEKYARMMESTSPCECRGIGAVVPKLEERTARLVEDLTRMSVRWREEVEAAYPFLSGRGRPIRAWEDDRYAVSFETYLRSEISTYSEHTLELIEEHYQALERTGRNPAQMILRDTVERYGYASLERAESAARTHAERTARADTGGPGSMPA
jgi:hypothetical protein